LCKALARAGHEVHVFTTNVDGPGESNVPVNTAVLIDGVHVWYFDVPSFRRLYRSPALATKLEQQVARFDVAHLHSVFLWPTWAAASAAHSHGVPYVISPRGMLVKDLIRRKSRWTKTAWIALVERRNLERAAAIHVTSAGEAEALKEFGFRLKRMEEIPNGVELPPETSGTESANSEHSRDVLFIGRISWKKGLDRVIRAISRLPGVNLTIAGNDEEGYTRELRQIADAVKVAQRVEFLPPVYEADKWRLLRSARCFVLPSHSENFGNAALEAMAAGCPVVMTAQVGLSAVVEACGAGVVTKGEPVALANALQRVLGDSRTRAEMGRAGRRLALDQYAWDAVAGRMSGLYESIAAR
jgi:glycosyltransferase involved in cell wall biosynthesis